MSTESVPRSAARDAARGVTIEAPAKVNLWLDILAREESGYHQLESLFCALDLADRVTVEAAEDGVQLEVDGSDIGPAHRNLAHRAAVAFFEATAKPAGARITLEKQIPAGAGLGGGSSDAAATLLGLNTLCGQPLDPATLFRVGSAVGSDVPFFLTGAPLALAWSRGERLLTLEPLPPRPTLVVMPPFRVDTPDAYRRLDEARGRARRGRPGLPPLGPASLSDWDAIAELARNEFEPIIFRRHPLLAELLDRLGAHGARIARMTGSGSAVFGIFDRTQQRDAAALDMSAAADGLLVLATATRAERWS
ncbi:MAG: 4-(cytidine 5'-diphospho)-2-C-methyl-D-erythritol kinase [Longimicrobiales bacterium]